MQAQWHLVAAMPLVCTPPKHVGEGRSRPRCPYVLTFYVIAVMLLLFIVESV